MTSAMVVWKKKKKTAVSAGCGPEIGFFNPAGVSRTAVIKL